MLSSYQDQFVAFKHRKHIPNNAKINRYAAHFVLDNFNFFRQVIHEILPKLAKKRVDRLMEFCQDSQFKLEIIPSATEEYVDSLTFLDEIQEQVSG